MRNKRLRSARKKGDNINERPNLIDFISKMPDDVLVKILSRLPIKNAVATSRLSKRWRFLWRDLIRLNFDGTDSLFKTADDEELCDSELEESEYINQVYEVISNYNHPRVQAFQIRFDLDDSSSDDIDMWIRFAIDKKVEKLKLDLMVNRDEPENNYDLWLPSSKAVVANMKWLRKLFLKGVNLNESTLNQVVKNSPNLEKLYMYNAVLSPHIHVGGQDTNLKHFTLVDCCGLESITLHNFDLVSFTYCGPEIKLHLTDLPKLKELDIGEVSVGFENNVFSQIASCALHLQVLSLHMRIPKKGLNVNAIPKLPNVKKLMLVMGAEEDDSLLEFTSIAQACPILEILSIVLLWFSPINRRRKVRHVATPHLHEHLKVLEILGYYGRISDLELAVYAIDHAVALKKIVINPCCHTYSGDSFPCDFWKREQAARSAAKRQLTPIVPPGVNLAVL